MKDDSISRRNMLGAMLAAGGGVSLISGCSQQAQQQQPTADPIARAHAAAERSPDLIAETVADERMSFFNPLVSEGADPWMVFHDGYYYFTCTSGSSIEIRRSRSIADIAGSRPRTVWRDDIPSRASQMWAPEFYLLEGPNGPRWYLYYCASDGDHLNHRCHVLESQSDTPLGPYTYKGQLRTDDDDKFYAIDAGVLVTSDKQRMHVAWAGHPGHVIYFADLENPWTTRGRRVHLPAEGFGCEEVREGPVFLVRGGKVFLIYSICDTGKPDYKLGMLVADEKSDLLRPESWKQHPEPVFVRNDEAGVYGPGHNGFFTSPDGTESWIIYHAKSTPMYTYRTRTTRAQKFTWRADGTPDFGKPLGLNAVIPVPSGDPGARGRNPFAAPTTRP